MNERVTVLYIGGHGRSGSTILAQTLGQIPGFVNVGEIRHVWYRGLRDHELCGCGQPFNSCEFWNAVGDEAFGGWDSVDVDKMLALKPTLEKLRYIPHYALAVRTGIHSHRMDELFKECGSLYERLYRAIQSVSGGRVIVDSSKNALYATFLSMLQFADLRVVHLIRDSRAVAYSWAKSKVRPEIVGQKVFMPRLSPVQASRAWSVSNYSYSLLSGFTHFSRLRYEDFANDPAFYVGGALTRLGLGDDAGIRQAVQGREISPTVDHTVSGNPDRFRTGAIELRPDEEWRAKMEEADKNVVTALTAPLLLKYGYFSTKKTITSDKGLS